jgi:hypothetical protein
MRDSRRVAVGREGAVAVDEQLHGQRRRADVLEAQLPRKAVALLPRDRVLPAKDVDVVLG